MKKSYFRVIKTGIAFYLILGLGTLMSGCGGSSSPTPTTSPIQSPTSSAQAIVNCASGALCPPSNVSVVNAK